MMGQLSADGFRVHAKLPFDSEQELNGSFLVDRVYLDSNMENIAVHANCQGVRMVDCRTEAG